jgi:hypothetical protein
MRKNILLIASILFLLSCSDKTKENSEMPDSNNQDHEVSCGNTEINYDKPVLPVEVNVPEIKKYSGEVAECMEMPSFNNGKILLKQGCYKGCLFVEGTAEIIGAGTEKTLIVCNDNEKEGVVEIAEKSVVTLKNLSLNGITRGIYVGSESMLNIENIAIYNVMKGGVNVCGDSDSCNSSVTALSILINDIRTDESKISYGISMGPGSLHIEDSKLSGFNSFGISLWGTENSLIKAVIENTVVSDVTGGSREYEGHGIYGENKVDVTISKSLISECSSTFIFISGAGEKPSVKIMDLVADTIVEGEKEQGGIVFNEGINASMEKILIKNSKGNGVFVKDSDVNAQDVTIAGVSHDGFGENGFGVMLFDSSRTFFNRISVTDSEIAGILMDGKCCTEIENFYISDTKPEKDTLEYGIGIAVQDGAELKLKKGVVERNRECGVIVISGNLQLKDVLIRDTLPRKCQEKGICVFAPGIPFGHGISLYNDSKMVFNEIYLHHNSNGINLESSEIVSEDKGSANFTGNINAVNAWNIKDYFALEKNLENAEFCDNDSVFTTDMQPVRDRF